MPPENYAELTSKTFQAVLKTIEKWRINKEITKQMNEYNKKIFKEVGCIYGDENLMMDDKDSEWSETTPLDENLREEINRNQKPKPETPEITGELPIVEGKMPIPK